MVNIMYAVFYSLVEFDAILTFHGSDVIALHFLN